MRNNDLEIVWTRPARKSIEAIHHHITRDNPKAADIITDEIKSRVTQLAEQPGLGFRSRVRSSLGDVREIVVRPYRILYLHDQLRQQLIVLEVWHGSRRDPRLDGIRKYRP